MITFVDTNVLVYAHDLDAGEKRTRAGALLRDLWENRDGVVSTQVLQEFYVNVTRKLTAAVSRRDARHIVQSYATWRVVAIDPADVLAASEHEERFQLSFWDALIVASALKARAGVLLTEDLQAGRRIQGLEIRNPFVGE